MIFKEEGEKKNLKRFKETPGCRGSSLLQALILKTLGVGSG
jgi:hypothetical protein